MEHVYCTTLSLHIQRCEHTSSASLLSATATVMMACPKPMGATSNLMLRRAPTVSSSTLWGHMGAKMAKDESGFVSWQRFPHCPLASGGLLLMGNC
jgi:hypothetical protein